MINPAKGSGNDVLPWMLDLTDNPPVDLLLVRMEPAGDVDLPHARALLVRLRQA